jgi:hypothetical protein
MHELSNQHGPEQGKAQTLVYLDRLEIRVYRLLIYEPENFSRAETTYTLEGVNVLSS